MVEERRNHLLPPLRRLLKILHPEAIPWPGAFFYSALSGSAIFQRHYQMVAGDILTYCREGRILDVGTGPGWLLVKLKDLSPALLPTGLDASETMVSKARDHALSAGCGEGIHVVRGNVMDLPFHEHTYDAVVSTGSIHHWKEPLACLEEVYRVLRPGGYALMYDLVSDTPPAVLSRAKRAFGKLRIFLLWLHAFEEPFYSKNNFERLALSSRFKSVGTRFIGVMNCMVLRKETD
jgi:ubiquinone/menaquinone biosynthesis C-methylase UbiE